jgi:hypothetical protein
VYLAHRELRRERALHGWGWRFRKPDGWMYATDTVASPPFTGDRRRTVLGHPWTVPQDGGREPEGFGAQRFGPWPAQVETALSILLPGFADPADPSGYYAGVARLPCDDRADAQWLMRWTYTVPLASRPMFARFEPAQRNGVTADVAGLWRNVALNPAWPRQSAWYVGVLATMGMTPGDDVFWLQQALYADLAAAAHPRDLGDLIERLDWLVPDSGSAVVRPGPPHAARLALARRVDALPDTIPVRTRAGLAHRVMRALDPAAPRGASQSGGDRRHEEDFAAYRAWFAANRGALEARAATQSARVAAARRAMDAVPACRGAR